MATRSELGPGVTLGQYRVLARLATGGLMDVWLAELKVPELTRRVVLKALRPQFVEDPLLLKTFMAEAAIAAKLVHPNVVEVLDFGEVEGNHFLATEFVFGRTLGQIVRRAKKMGRSLHHWLPVRVAIEVCSALASIHAFEGHGYVHRDVSAENIMVAFTGVVKLLDFGIVAANVAPAKGRLLGKTRYMAPERIAASECAPRSDVFALGVVLYESLAGAPPFESAEEMLAALQSGAADAVRSPRAHNALIDEELARIILQAIALDPRQRYQSADVLAQDLRRFLARADPDGLYAPIDSYVSDLFLGETSASAEPLSKRRFPSSPAPVSAPSPSLSPSLSSSSVADASLAPKLSAPDGLVEPVGPIDGYVPPTIPPVASQSSRATPRDGVRTSRPSGAASFSKAGASTPPPLARATGSRQARLSGTPTPQSSPSRSSGASTTSPVPASASRSSPSGSLVGALPDRPVDGWGPVDGAEAMDPSLAPTPPRPVPESLRLAPATPPAPQPPMAGRRDAPPVASPSDPGEASLTQTWPHFVALPQDGDASPSAQARMVTPLPAPPSPPGSTRATATPTPRPSAASVVPAFDDGAPLSGAEAATGGPVEGGARGLSGLFDGASRPPPPRSSGNLFPGRPSFSSEELANAGSKDLFASRGSARTHLAFSTAKTAPPEVPASTRRLGSVFATKKVEADAPLGSQLSPEAQRAAAAFDRGLESFGKKNHEQALSAWREAVALDPANRTYQANLKRLERLLEGEAS